MEKVNLTPSEAKRVMQCGVRFLRLRDAAADVPTVYYINRTPFTSNTPPERILEILKDTSND